MNYFNPNEVPHLVLLAPHDRHDPTSYPNVARPSYDDSSLKDIRDFCAAGYYGLAVAHIGSGRVDLGEYFVVTHLPEEPLHKMLGWSASCGIQGAFIYARDFRPAMALRALVPEEKRRYGIDSRFRFAPREVVPDDDYNRWLWVISRRAAKLLDVKLDIFELAEYDSAPLYPDFCNGMSSEDTATKVADLLRDQF